MCWDARELQMKIWIMDTYLAGADVRGCEEAGVWGRAVGAGGEARPDTEEMSLASLSLLASIIPLPAISRAKLVT